MAVRPPVTDTALAVQEYPLPETLTAGLLLVQYPLLVAMDAMGAYMVRVSPTRMVTEDGLIALAHGV